MPIAVVVGGEAAAFYDRRRVGSATAANEQSNKEGEYRANPGVLPQSQSLTLAGKFGAGEVMDLVKLVTYPETFPFRREFRKAGADGALIA